MSHVIFVEGMVSASDKEDKRGGGAEGVREAAEEGGAGALRKCGRPTCIV